MFGINGSRKGVRYVNGILLEDLDKFLDCSCHQGVELLVVSGYLNLQYESSCKPFGLFEVSAFQAALMGLRIGAAVANSTMLVGGIDHLRQAADFIDLDRIFVKMFKVSL